MAKRNDDKKGLGGLCSKRPPKDTQAPPPAATKPGKEKAESPYLAGRREWQERYGDYIKQAATWRMVALVSLAVAAIAVIGVVYIGSRSQFVPYVVQVDKLGDAVAVRPASVAARPDPRVIKASLARFVVETRSVYVDSLAQRRFLDDAYAHVVNGGAAFMKLNDWYRKHNPFTRAKKKTVAVQITTAPAAISKDSWQVTWTETVRGRDGGVISRTPWTAVITIKIQPPTTQAGILRNPLGIYIKQFTWSPRIAGAAHSE